MLSGSHPTYKRLSKDFYEVGVSEKQVEEPKKIKYKIYNRVDHKNYSTFYEQNPYNDYFKNETFMSYD